MTEKSKQWQLQKGIKMNDEVAAEVAKIACALKSLAVFSSLVIEQEDCPEDLQKVVDEGVEAINKLFVW